jgi:glycosyltransferase involved in cell wall biosynthesis
MTIDKPEFLKTVSIIVPAHNEASSLPHLLNALNNQTYPKELVEIIVVDNRSSDDTARVAQSAGAKVLTEHSEASSDVARNAAIKIAKGDVLAFTDADCRPDKNWLVSLLGSMPSDRHALVAGQIIIEIDENSSGAEIYDSMAFLKHDNSIKFRKIAFTANLAVPRTVALAVGGIPTKSKTNGDSYFSRACYHYGCELIYVPSAVVRHRARKLPDLLLKAKRIAKGNVLGGDRDSAIPKLRNNGYQKGPATIMTMPHLAALSPRAIATHLRSRNIEVNVRRVFSTCFAGVGVLACGLLYSLYFSANKTKILSKPRQQIAT